MISASNAGATILCPAREVLPHAKDTGAAAERGTALHTFARICTVNPSGRDAALAEVPEDYRSTARGMNVEAALDGLRVIGCERAYALNVKTKTVRFVGENIGRNYGKLEKYELPFTIDVEAFFGDVPVELDYKSGQYTGPVRENWQRRVCATGLMLFYGTPTAISRIAYIWQDGSIKPDGDPFDILDAEEYCDTLVEAFDRVESARAMLADGQMPTLYPSDEACNYCPAFTFCPYQTNFARSMLGTLKAIEDGPDLSELTATQILESWDKLKFAEKIIEHQLKAYKDHTKSTRVVTAEGTLYELRPKAKSREYFNDSAARGMLTALLQKEGLTDEEIAAKMKSLYGKTEYEEIRKVKKSA